MLKIQVLGKGMIPRGYGLAPRLEPFYADITFIHTIIETPGLTVRYLNPVTNKLEDINRNNLKKVYDKYANMTYDKNTPVHENTKPHIPDAKNTITGNKVNISDIVMPPTAKAVDTVEIIHTNPPQYENTSAAALNKAMHDFATKNTDNQVKETTSSQDHTKVESKKDDAAQVSTDNDKKDVTITDDEVLKPINAPDKNQNNKNNGKK